MAASGGLAIAFDGDDTLWHNEIHFADTQARLREILSRHVDGPTIDRTLYARERANLSLFGYGVKGFTLSMVETAIEVSRGTVGAHEIQELIDLGKAMLARPVEAMDGARETVERLRADGHRLFVITKGDLFDQETKLAGSGLAELFEAVEIVSEKDEGTYRTILDRHAIDRDDFLMIGNSVRSDILPVLALGGHGVHIPYHVTWAHETVAADDLPPFPRLAAIGEVPDFVSAWQRDRMSAL